MEPIAICGMSMRLPGGINDASSFWDLLYHSRSGQCPVPADRYKISTWYAPGKPGHVNSKVGYFIDRDLACTDTSFWTMTKKEIEVMDPQQRLTLEMVYECLQTAGQKPNELRGRKIGVFLGTFEGDWLELDGRDTQNSHVYRLQGYGDYMSANRIHYEFNFTGPSVTIRTACSSSLVALDYACRALAAGDCDAAVVAAVNLIFSPRTTGTMQEQGVMSATGSCKSFDADADGYARGEAASAVYVKRLSDAIRDGDPVRAVVRGSAVNAGGRAPSLSSPNVDAHEALIRRVHEVAGLMDFSKTAMIECHGTGTPIGDPIETAAVARVFGPHGGIYIGSVKPNLGHSEGASGLSSVIKMVLALEHKTIPPNINFKTPNPRIPFKEAGLVVPIKPMSWPKERAERVCVNSFGIGGSNACVLLESAGENGVGGAAASRHLKEHGVGDDGQPCLLVFSAKHPEALKRSVGDHEQYLAAHPLAVKDGAYSLAAKREVLSYRQYGISVGGEALKVSKTAKPSPLRRPEIVFVFTGQGAQWAQMGKELMTSRPVFRETLEKLDEALALLPDPPTWKLSDEILRPAHESRLSEAEISQPCCTAIQIALVDLLTSWKVGPAAVVGHSSGEIAAAYACGAISAADAISIACHRGLSMRMIKQKVPGGMAAIGLGREEVSSYLKPGVIIGCENSPESVTLSGDKDVLADVLRDIRAAYPETLVRILRVDCAYDSHHMLAVAEEYEKRLQSLAASRKPEVPFYSAVTSEKITEGNILDAAYWVRNLTSPVLFSNAIQELIDDRAFSKTFLEIGPHSALAGPLRQIFRAIPSCKDEYIPSLIRGENASVGILKTAGELWLNNIAVDLETVSGKGKFLVDLPLYPWHYEERLWSESRLSSEWRFRKHAHHDVLGSRVLETTNANVAWRNILRLDNVPWIKGHEVAGDILFPGVGYIGMIAEAIRQLTNSLDLTVRQVHIKTGLVLHESQETELITELRRINLTSTLESEWFDFSISSLQGSVWIKHCIGKARAGPDMTHATQHVASQPRKVPSHTWYRAMQKLGFEYGSRFLCMKDITAHPVNKIATATIADDRQPGESPWIIHPAPLDAILQIFSVAAYHGSPRKFPYASVPTYIDELYIKPAKGPITLRVEADEVPTKGSISGNLVGVAGGETVIDMRGVALQRIGDVEGSQSGDSHAGVELVWKEDLNFVDVEGMRIQSGGDGMMDRFALACLLETQMRVGRLETEVPHLKRFKEWLDGSVEEARGGRYPGVVDARDIIEMTGEARRDFIDRLHRELKDASAAPAAEAVYRTMLHCEEIFRAGAEPLTRWLPEDMVQQLYGFRQDVDYSEFLEFMAHRKPNMKIFEIGAGTGKFTNTVLPHLKAGNGERMYFSYTYTDISPDVLASAKERFKSYDGMEYAVLDITKDVVEQGFEVGSFDLILASNVLRAISLRASLDNVKRLLHPQGRLVLQELWPTAKWLNFVMGVFPNWRLGNEDQKLGEPYADAKTWEKEFQSTGFNEIAITHNHSSTTTILARLPQPTPPKHITLLRDDPPSIATVELISSLEALNYTIHHCTIASTPPANQDILSVLDFPGPFLHDANEEDLNALFRFLLSIRNAGILWVTRACQVHCVDPRYAVILGLARNAFTEMELEFATLELQDWGSGNLKYVPRVLGEFQTRVTGGDVDPTMEWAVHEGRVLTSRYRWVNVGEELRERSGEGRKVKLEVGKLGLVDSLVWREGERGEGHGEVEGDLVEVEVRAVGLNFKDVLVVTGVIVDQRAIGHGLGYECCGIVTKVGLDARHLKVGDRVYGSSGGGALTNRLVLREDLCVRIPDRMSAVEAATMPIVYATAMYCLEDIARLRAGMTILIHSAAGGVGIAAIQIAKMIGAEIYCTVGSVSKADHLINEYGINPNRVFSSRDGSFLPAILEATNGKGIDVVLNSLSGELLHASWKCVAEFGTMVEIGRRDFAGQGKLAMEAFESNRTFAGFDLMQLVQKRPEMVQILLKRATEYYEKGFIKPIGPCKEFAANEIGEALRYMQKGQRMGKIVVTMPEKTDEFSIVLAQSKLQLRADSAYFFVGGLGGIGRAVATWLVENGAKKLVLFSRSAGEIAVDDPYIEELEAQGCSVQTISGSVSRIEDVEAAFNAIDMPVGGILQASMSLDDVLLQDMTPATWSSAIAPKVQGTWNLHHTATKHSSPLDFFFLFSSISSMGRQRGQTNYAAGNAFLDAFVQYRHSLGLPCSAVNIGIMDDIGYLADHPEKLAMYRATGAYTLQEKQLLDGIQLMLMRSKGESGNGDVGFVEKSQLAIGIRSTIPLSAPNNRTFWRRDARFLAYRNSVYDSQGSGSSSAAPSSDGDELRSFLRDARSNIAMLKGAEAAEYLAGAIGKTLLGFMLADEDLDLQASVTALGMDSLITIELKNWIRQRIGVEMSVMEIMGAESIMKIGVVAQGKLLEKMRV